MLEAAMGKTLILRHDSQRAVSFKAALIRSAFAATPRRALPGAYLLPFKALRAYLCRASAVYVVAAHIITLEISQQF